MADIEGKTRPELPVELYTHALEFLDPNQPSSVETLFSVLWTNNYLRTAASVSSLWKPYHDLRYTQCVPENKARRRAQFGEDYYKLYMKRRELDHRALTLVDAIRLEIPGRSARARVLAQELSFDVWDVLRAETVLPLPEYFRSPRDEITGEAAPQAFPRRYWARAVQGVIARYWAVRMWQRAVAGDPGVTFEEVLLGFSTFCGWSPYAVCVHKHHIWLGNAELKLNSLVMQLAQELDSFAANCRQTFLTQKVVLDQADPKFDLAKACDTTIFYMRAEGWMDGEGARVFRQREASCTYLQPYCRRHGRTYTEHLPSHTLDRAVLIPFECLVEGMALCCSMSPPGPGRISNHGPTQHHPDLLCSPAGSNWAPGRRGVLFSRPFRGATHHPHLCVPANGWGGPRRHSARDGMEVPSRAPSEHMVHIRSERGRPEFDTVPRRRARRLAALGKRAIVHRNACNTVCYHDDSGR